MIEAEGLVKRYGTVTAVEDISFNVQQGEILGFLGPNGAGKTTTMRILTGYLPPSAGSASIAGHDVFRNAIEARRNLGYLPESVPLYPEMTVAGYLDYMARLRRISDRREAIEHAMEMVDITDRAESRIGKLSKGYRQRVGLAQALLHDPPVLILDEPTVGLDPRQIIEVRELIRDLGKERTIILSTHILPEVSQLCNRVIILREGQIAAIDTPQELTARLQGEDRIYLHLEQPTPETADELKKLDGVLFVQEQDTGQGTFEVQCERDQNVRPALAALVVQHGWGLLEMRPVGMSMEEIFLELTTQEEEKLNDQDDEDDADNEGDEG
jgi:ABC-2 type transport system ATP-binding protein